MVFSSIEFVFLFLPLVLGVYVLVPSLWFRNLWLLAASLFFYAWGEKEYTTLMAASIFLNYGFGLLIHKWKGSQRRGRFAVSLAIASNLSLLIWFKYAAFLCESVLNPLLGFLGLDPIGEFSIHNPIGISFFSFQAMSYVVDVYRQETPPQKNPLKLGLYISMFPQLIAGPIVRYHDVAREMSRRTLSLDRSAKGIRIFTVGLGKKMILANSFGLVADQIFGLSSSALSPGSAWVGVIAYSFQIFFDFSGYSDMAIGLGHLLGFKFPENFRYPYIARSVKDFWGRWHISLSTWFRDYLYIPLGGSRAGASKTARNLLVVFFLCGLWHGASWNFIIWGLFHGSFLILERIATAKTSTLRFPVVIQHVYTLLVVSTGWVFFRAETLPQALDYLSALWGTSGSESLYYPVSLWVNLRMLLLLPCAILASTPWVTTLHKHVKDRRPRLAGLVEVAGMWAVWLISAALLYTGTHNPFIYFRF